jgi:predicted acylesterase/phospholipase RssA
MSSDNGSPKSKSRPSQKGASESATAQTEADKAINAFNELAAKDPAAASKWLEALNDLLKSAPSAKRDENKLKRAICLGGGGPAAGLHIGVLEGLQDKQLEFNDERSIWALSCIGAWVGIVYNQVEKGSKIAQTFDFFRDLFREDKSFESFPINTIFAPDWGGNAEAILNFLLEPKNYTNAFLPREIVRSFVHTLSLLTDRQNWGKFSEGDFNRWTLNHLLAIHPGVRFLTALLYKSEINGATKLHYPDSKFLKGINFEALKDRKPYIVHNAWNLSTQDIELFANKSVPGGRAHKEISAASVCACSALPFIEQTVEIDGHSYCEGALVDTMNFKDLLADHHHPENGDPLDEIWISRIVDASQIRRPANLHDSLANLCELFAATVGEDDVNLFKFHVKESIAQNDPQAFRGTIVEIQVSSDITYEWSHKNLEVGRRNGRDAAHAAFEDYVAAGGPQPHGQLRIIGELRRGEKRNAIKAARQSWPSPPSNPSSQNLR